MQTNIHINGISLGVQQLIFAKERPTIVFLHDSLGSIALWRDFPKQLGELANCNVLVYDRQGYGVSDPFTTKRNNDYLEKEADVLHQLIVQLSPGKVILFGHSDGGSIALIAAAKYPQQIIGIITEGAHIFVEDVTLDGIRSAVKAYESTALKDRLEKYHGSKTPDVFTAWTETWLSEGFRQWNIERFLPSIKCPLLVMQGENDEYGSEAQVDGIIQNVAGKAEKVMVENAGHTPHREAAALVLARTAEFVSSCDNGSK